MRPNCIAIAQRRRLPAALVENVFAGRDLEERADDGRAGDSLLLIVASPFVDLTEYLDTVESGAADYVVPPFLGTDIAHVLMAAVGKAQTGPGAP